MQRLSSSLIIGLTFALVALACLGGAIWAVGAIENRSGIAVRRALLLGTEDWAEVRTDGLRVILTGTAASEAARFRALTLAGRAVEPTRVIDEMTVTPAEPVAPPRFSVELLRNDSGISVIGLIPAAGSAPPLSARIARAAPGARITDMMEQTTEPAPEGWASAVRLGLAALERLPRSKISISAGAVAITAVSDSPAEKRRLEAEIAALVPPELSVAMDISAPRPVITPFTLRFISDEAGARFDACSADNDGGRKRILAAAVAAGATGKATCTLGLGVPSPRWAEAAVLGIGAVAELGQGSVTFSDADVSLIAEHTVPQDRFDRVVGELEARLPPVFSLTARRKEAPAPPADTAAPPPVFTASRHADGRVELRGRLPDELVREAVASFARAKFGADAVFMAARLDEALPEGWPQRAFAGIEALAELHHGSLLIRADLVDLRGVTGNPEASDRISRILSDRLGEGQAFSIDLRYDEALDPLANLPTPEECVTDVNDILTANKVNFDPGSANIEAAAGGTLNAIADILRQCPGVRMEIGGHTDNQGRAVMNQELSQRRAEAVLHALMERRVLIGNLVAKGYGSEQPIADNDTEEGREANRRIEFRLIEPEPSEADSAAEAVAEGGAEAGTDAGADAGADAGTGGGTDDETGAPQGAASATGGATAQDAEAGPETGTEAEPETGTETGAETGADSAADSTALPDAAGASAAPSAGEAPSPADAPADVGSPAPEVAVQTPDAETTRPRTRPR